MIQELKKDANLAWADELKSIKVKLNKNERVFCFPNFNGSETQENFYND